MLLPVVALAFWQPVKMHSEQDVRTLAGTWSSSTLVGAPPVFEHTILVIHKDGTYQLSGFGHSKGTIEIAQNGKYLKVGPFDLWVYRTGKSPRDQVLEGDGNGAEVAFGRVHTSMAPSAAIG
jgi:hypothetical protein